MEHLPKMSQLCPLAVTAGPQEGGSGEQEELRGPTSTTALLGKARWRRGRHQNKVLFVIALLSPGVKAKNAVPLHSLQKGIHGAFSL